MPSIIMVLILFFPESPRWLIAKDRREEALAVLAKYHGDGDENSPIVQLVSKYLSRTGIMALGNEFECLTMLEQ